MPGAITTSSMPLSANIEALLFVAGKPMTVKKIAEFVDAREKETEQALYELQTAYAAREAGVRIFSTGREWQMGTSGDCAAVVEKFVREEFSGELTRPQLETLTVIGYRGPISKGELEIIRGVSCGLILRNLLIRGLIDEEFDSTLKQNKYRVSIDFLRHLGLHSVEALPEYAAMHSHEVLQTLLAQSGAEETKGG